MGNDFLKELGVETISESRSRRTMSLKERILNSINKEIELINGRDDLELKRIPKMVNGKETEVNENRFWKHSHSQKNKLLVSIKLKGKTFGLGKEVDRHKPNYILIENSKEQLIKLLENVSKGLEKIDEDDDKFWKI